MPSRSSLLDRLAATRTYQYAYPVSFLLIALIIALPPTLLTLLRHPFSVFDIRTIFFAHAWRILSPALDPGDAPHKRPLLAHAHGVVLEIGPGVGDNIKYYERSSISRLVLVEPNGRMHAALRRRAAESGFHECDGTLQLLGCGGGVGDEAALQRAGVGSGSIDTVVVVHVLCSVPRPALAAEMYRRLLRRGGSLLFYEHVRSTEPQAAAWQAWLTRWVWRAAFDGCELDRPTGAWIKNGPAFVDVGTEARDHQEDESGERRWTEWRMEAPEGQARFACTPHVWGWGVKA